MANIGQILIKYKAHIKHCLVLRPADLDDASNVNCTVMFQNISVVYHAYQTFVVSSFQAHIVHILGRNWAKILGKY